MESAGSMTGGGEAIVLLFGNGCCVVEDIRGPGLVIRERGKPGVARYTSGSGRGCQGCWVRIWDYAV